MPLAVARGVHAVLGHHEQRDRAFDQGEDGEDSCFEAVGPADDFGDHLGGADGGIGLDLGKRRPLGLEPGDDRVEVMDIAVHHHGKDAETRGEHHRLDVVADHADAVGAAHLFVSVPELRPEVLPADVVNLALDPPVAVDGHPGVIGAEVAVIVEAVIEGLNAVPLPGCCAENAGHTHSFCMRAPEL